MQIRYSLLSPGLRSEWLSVPASRADPSLGVARVQVRELPAGVWDEVWTDLLAAEGVSREIAEQLRKANPEEREGLRRKLLASREEERLCGRRLLRLCVIDHDVETFIAEVPVAAPGSPEHAQILAALIETGYNAEEAAQAARSGKAGRRFGKGSIEVAGQAWQGADEETVAFYERCQPDGRFASLLTLCIARYQQGEVLTPEAIWSKAGVLPLASSREEGSP